MLKGVDLIRPRGVHLYRPQAAASLKSSLGKPSLGRCPPGYVDISRSMGTRLGSESKNGVTVLSTATAILLVMMSGGG